ncbi:MAG: hypothetical protein HQ517_10110 [SAR324 cluster bacterium]|nr:hypothetical protein [SAR324 cluster bacterium]
MSSGSSLPYRLRQNIAVDRELFLALLGRLTASLKLEEYRYIGLGGPFLEDFRLIHAKLGLTDLKCIESEEDVHSRQKFNRPVNSIECIHSTLEDYMDMADFDKPVIIWFDYTDPRKITEQIERFARTISQVPINSILRITLNASPSSLGKPDDIKEDIHVWRLDQFRTLLGSLFPVGIQEDGMRYRNYGKTLLRALYLAVEKEVLNLPDLKTVWSLSTHYADGQPMATATLHLSDPGNNSIENQIENWEYLSTPDNPLLIDMPALSTLERLIMESSEDPKLSLGFSLPLSDMQEDPYDSFKKYYRVFPHFARVEV